MRFSTLALLSLSLYFPTNSFSLNLRGIDEPDDESDILIEDLNPLFEGSWEFTGEYEIAGISSCPDIFGGETATEGFNGYVGSICKYQIVHYIPAKGEFLLSLKDSLHYLAEHFGHDTHVLHIGDSISNILRFSALCSASANDLPIDLSYRFTRWMVDNPCGCDNPEIIAHFALEYKGCKTCTPGEHIMNWKKDIHFESADMIIIQMGTWWDPSYPCMHNDEEYVEEQFLNTIAHHLREIKTYIARGKLVFWVGLLPSPEPTNPWDLFGKSFGRRNQRIAKVLSGSGIVFINPYDVFLSRFNVDRSYKHDDMHIYGYGPNSPGALINQFIFSTAAKIKGATYSDRSDGNSS